MANISGIIKSIRDIMWQDTGLNGDAQRVEQLGWMLFLKIFSDKDKELETLDDNYSSPIPYEFRWENWAGNDEGLTGDELLEFVDRKLFPSLRNIGVISGNKRALIVREVFEGNNNYMKSGINIRKVLNKLNEIDFNIAKDRHAFGEIYEGILKELQSAGKSGEFYTPRAITQFITEIINPKPAEKILDPSCGTGGFLTCAIEHLKNQINTVSQRQDLQENVKGFEYKPLPYLLATTNLILHDIEVPNIIFRDALEQPLISYKEKDRVDVILANPPFGGIVANNNENNFPQNYRTKESADLFLILMIHLLKKDGRAGIVLPDGSLTGEGVKQRVREKLLRECNLHTIIRLPNSVFQPYATVATNLLFFNKEIQNAGDSFATKEIWYYEHRKPFGQKAYSKTKPIRLQEFEPIKMWWNNRNENEVCWKIPIQTIIERGYDLDIKNPNKQENNIEYSSAELMQSLEKSFAKSQKLLGQLKEAMEYKGITNKVDKLWNEKGLTNEDMDKWLKEPS
ncbi:MAG: N-6 DNA methylase [Desulfobacterales bacterium]|nr:N-6 DNA methylase [Desulfobacterales bacterium]